MSSSSLPSRVAWKGKGREGRKKKEGERGHRGREGRGGEEIIKMCALLSNVRGVAWMVLMTLYK